MTATLLHGAHATGGRPVRSRGAHTAWSTVVLVLVACLALAVVSVITLPTVPFYDEFSWLVWGRELAHHVIGPHERFVLAGGASWKPLPVAVTTVLGFFGSAAVTLWVVFVRTVGLVGLWLAYRLGSRLGASDRWRAAAPVGGVLAAIAVMLTYGWFGFMLSATSEPLTITAALLWVDRILAGRRLQALTAGVALALMRPEAGALVALYALWCLWRETGVPRRLLVVGEGLLVPLAWIGIPWLADGSALQAANRAKQYGGNDGHNLATIALTRAEGVMIFPVLIAAAAMVVWALWRRDRTVIALALAAVAYLAVIEVMTVGGFPGLTRFMLPAAAIVSVLAGAGVAQVASLLGGGAGSAVLAIVLIALAVPDCLSFPGQIRSDRRDEMTAMHAHTSLVSAVARAKGSIGVLPCATSSASINWREAPELAWILDAPLTRIHQATGNPATVGHPGVGFFAPHRPTLGQSPSHPAPGLHERLLWRDGPWRVVQVSPIGAQHADRCIGV